MLTILRNEINCSLICVRALRGRYNGLRHGRRNERMPSLLYKSPSAFGQFNINTARSYYFVVWVWEPFQRRGSHSCSRKKKANPSTSRATPNQSSFSLLLRQQRLIEHRNEDWIHTLSPPFLLLQTRLDVSSFWSALPISGVRSISPSHSVCVCVWCSCYHRNNANNSIVVKMMATKFDASRLHPPVGRYI